MLKFRFTLARLGFSVLFIALTMVQILSFPGQFAYMRKTQGISLMFEVLLTLTVGLWIACGQFAIVCLWKIIALMQNSRFYTKTSIKWIDWLMFIFKLASFMAVVLFLLIASVADDPGILVVLSVLSLIVFTLTLTVSLLRDQIQLMIS